MLSLRTLAFAAATFTLGLAGCTQTPVDRDAHPPYAGPAADSASMSRMDGQMKTMQAMHDRVMQAQTPEQRSALMAEHMKVMQDSMAMMGGMGPGSMMGKGGMGAMHGMHGNGAMNGGMDHQMMEKRMQMMESTMQMMVDRLPPAPAKP